MSLPAPASNALGHHTSSHPNLAKLPMLYTPNSVVSTTGDKAADTGKVSMGWYCVAFVYCIILRTEYII